MAGLVLLFGLGAELIEDGAAGALRQAPFLMLIERQAAAALERAAVEYLRVRQRDRGGRARAEVERQGVGPSPQRGCVRPGYLDIELLPGRDAVDRDRQR